MNKAKPKGVSRSRVKFVEYQLLKAVEAWKMGFEYLPKDEYDLYLAEWKSWNPKKVFGQWCLEREIAESAPKRSSKSEKSKVK
jgi:hypothetical protein